MKVFQELMLDLIFTFAGEIDAFHLLLYPVLAFGLPDSHWLIIDPSVLGLYFSTFWRSRAPFLELEKALDLHFEPG